MLSAMAVNVVHYANKGIPQFEACRWRPMLITHRGLVAKSKYERKWNRAQWEHGEVF